ncbi:uncharacterized protein PV07_00403 [Cladophialophora immunda]|uniref:Alpha-1,3-mannosyltransferase n=1 Tax=Cladophialophora immunda TaxID=569365 RepID=A0A0D2CQU8_9EURO|nr:uncharacterized protein PV07_00403 [Cladophialophora immunda]KIW33563.1 hypothetical protein PV07_00403 [Cladophialophora immunda]OQV04266.1 hypothetical protein CLAIMM_09176 [Cladophialophora immunda]
MPPHLHPRSTATSTLFAGTLLASFIVVGIPHVFPCPRPRTGYAADAGRIELDEDGNPVRRRQVRPGDKPSTSGNAIPAHCASRAPAQEEQQPPQPRKAPQGLQKGLTASKNLDEEAALFRELQAEAEMLEKEARSARECPVPKPKGWVGRILGFEEQGRNVADKEGG